MVEVRCPVCSSPFDLRHTPAMPFCSHRCRQIDLGRWLSEEYAVPVVNEDAEDDLEWDDREWDERM